MLCCEALPSWVSWGLKVVKVPVKGGGEEYKGAVVVLVDVTVAGSVQYRRQPKE